MVFFSFCDRRAMLDIDTVFELEILVAHKYLK